MSCTLQRRSSYILAKKDSQPSATATKAAAVQRNCERCSSPDLRRQFPLASLRSQLRKLRVTNDVTLLLREIMTDARDLTRAERCSLFLLDKEQKELVAKVFDGDLAEDGQETCTEVRIPADQGIAGRVATTGEVLNIRDAYNHPLFYRGMDEVTGFKTRNILCFPIKDDQEVIGVAELCNKSRKFTERPSIAKTETMALHGSGRLNVRFRKASGAAADKWSTRRFLHTRVFWTTGKISDEENLCPALLCPSGPKPKPRVRAGH